MIKILNILLVVFAFLFFSACDKDKEIKPTENQKWYSENYKYLDDEKSVFIKVDYDKLQEIIDGGESAIIYFGGSWCPNCQAVVKFVNEIAKEMYLSNIYNFDTKIDFNGEVRDIRRCNTDSDVQLWSDIVNKIEFSSGNVVMKDEVAVVDKNGKELSTMPVPTFVVIKEGKVVGQLTEELFYNPVTNTLWDTNTFDGNEVTEEFKTKVVSLFTIYDGCTDEECSA